MTHHDVVISGCGPVGATLAVLLATRGVNVLVAEKHPEIYGKPRAISMDWEVMRILQFCGVAHDFAPDAHAHPGTDFRGLKGQVIKRYDPLPPPFDLGWAPTLTFVQPELEALLRQALLRAGATLLSGHEVTGFQDRDDRVSVDIRDTGTGEARTVTADFLVGCDGANSDIRTALGLGLDDLGFDENWLVVDAHLTRDTDLPPKATQYCWPSRPATLIIGPKTLRRWELKIMPGETPEDFADEVRVRAAMAPYVDVDAIDIWRSATYRFAARVGTSWRADRVLLAGDAVHQTPPFLGQGMSAGMRDAANLAWKLAHIRRAGFNDALLDSYEAECKPHVAAVVAAAKEFGAVIGELDEAQAQERDRVLEAQLASGEMQTSRQGFIPNLETGVIAPEPGLAWPDQVAGKLMVQPEVVCPDGAARLLDDHVPMDFLYVTASEAAQDWMAGQADAWAAIGGRRLVIAAEGASPAGPLPAGVDRLPETGDTFARWRARTGFDAVLVRPDRYIYAGIAGRDDLAKKVATLTERLRAD